MSVATGVSTQLSLFDILDESICTVPGVPRIMPGIFMQEKEESEKLENFEDYVYRGERILTLLREEKKVRRVVPSRYFDKLNAEKYRENRNRGKGTTYLLDAAAKEARALWQSSDSTDIADNPLIRYLSKYLVVDAKLCSGAGREDVLRIFRYFFRKKGSFCDVCSVGIPENFIEVPMGKESSLPCSKHRKMYRPVASWRADYHMVGDAGRLFAFAYVLCAIKEQVQESITGLSEEELMDNVLYRTIKEITGKQLLQAEEKPLFYDVHSYQYPFLQELVRAHPHVFTERASAKEQRFFHGMKNLLGEWLLSSKEEDKLHFEDVYGSEMFMVPIFECTFPVLGCLVEKILNIYEEGKRQEDLEKAQHSESARVFQTKKNITQKCQKAMLESKFNDYFGYVELDDESDLEKFKIVEQQFEALCSLVFGKKKRERHSIRFRKLGRHHAYGLYFYNMNCLCVDVRATSSLAHEFFHLLDFENGKVSSGFAFQAVHECYKRCLQEDLEKKENEGLKKALRGKYDLNYYLDSAEAFARCGEMYLVRTLKVDNSLVEPDASMSFAYPDDEELMRLINPFFENFLRKIRN